MKLAEVLQNPPAPYHKGRLDFTLLDREVTRVEKRYGSADEALTSDDLSQLINNFRQRMKTGNWRKFSWSRSNALFRAFFMSELVKDKSYKDVEKVLIDTLAETDKRSFIRTAVDVVLTQYGTQTSHIVGKALAGKKRALLPPRMKLVDDFDVFGNDRLHEILGDAMARQNDPYGYLKSLGITSPHQKGLSEKSFDHMLAQMRERLAKFDMNAYDAVLAFLNPKGGSLYELRRARAVDAILKPFISGRNHNEVIQRRVQSFLVENLRDPRVNPVKWNGVSDESLAVVQKWLTTKSLEAFFDVISSFEDSHMWAPRRDFWSKINQQGHIKNAWVLLNEAGRQEADRLARDQKDETFRSYGRIDSESRNIDTCFFLVEFSPNLTALVGTKSYTLRFFRRGNPRKPQLNQQSYSLVGLGKREDADQAYYHRGDWQIRAYNYIRMNK